MRCQLGRSCGLDRERSEVAWPSLPWLLPLPPLDKTTQALFIVALAPEARSSRSQETEDNTESQAWL